MIKKPFWFVIIFIALKISILFFAPLGFITGLGDITHFYQLAEIPGLPFLDYWVEFPPLAPFFFELLYFVVSGQRADFIVGFYLITSLVNAGILFASIKLLANLFPNPKERILRETVLFIIFLIFPYSWWYFDVIGVLMLLLAIFAFIQNRHFLSVIFISIGALTKLFPALVLIFFLSRYKLTKSIKYIFLFFAIFFTPYIFLYYFSPEFTKASVLAQTGKGSWETIWALIDRNFSTGNFGPLWERLNPQNAFNIINNPAVVPSWLVFMFAFGFGLLIFLRYKKNHIPTALRFLLLTFCLMFLWSPGWSPQWVLFIIPILFFIDEKFTYSNRIVVLLLLINLAEWPIIIGFQLLTFLPVTILMRTAIFIFLIVDQTRKIISKSIELDFDIHPP